MIRSPVLTPGQVSREFGGWVRFEKNARGAGRDEPVCGYGYTSVVVVIKISKSTICQSAPFQE